MMRFLLSALFVLAALVQSPAATTTPSAGPAPLNGQWKGPLKLLGGQITVIITIVPLTNGTYYGALDAPQQRISRMPVAVELHGTDLKLRIEQAGSSFVGKVLNGGAKFSGTWTQAGVKTAMVLLRAPSAKAIAAAPFRPTPPYRVSEVVFPNPASRQNLGATLTVPAGEGPFPAVVLVSDLGPQGREVEVSGYRMFGQLADYLSRHGIAVLRYDDRGVGKSGGTYANATTADLVTDAQAALNFLRTRPLVAPQRVGLLGHGEGANVALLAAAVPGRAPAFVVSLAGYGQSGYSVLLRQQNEIMRLTGANAAEVQAAQDIYYRTVSIIRQTPDNAAASAKVAAMLSGANTGINPAMARARATQLTSPWSRYFFDFSPLTQLSKVQCPVLLLNGTADLQVSAKRNMTPLRRGLHAAHRSVTAYRLDGVNHLFQPAPAQWPLVNGVQQATFSPVALKKINDWVTVKTKQPTAAPMRAPQKLPFPAPRITKTGSVPRLRG
ncbi:alpha/beta fold hydrolase [Hymenobacter sp. BT770]|uniref:alpha/beta hydrolase family protein n=1 Tax=Hymenobacter sp. BT770 TaxID=2886942 RepID=UPI001D10A76E|nr:alpha/beta fold hydrolase [Hymenobacter sp. BT770]MCC3155053.1 alpha/beta fold hydrolase [Hymenobacter sp. BT770]MDO3416929.1 alpha/beta fold hydrolase [Hymenobacter sp. BT770]